MMVFKNTYKEFQDKVDEKLLQSLDLLDSNKQFQNISHEAAYVKNIVKNVTNLEEVVRFLNHVSTKLFNKLFLKWWKSQCFIVEWIFIYIYFKIYFFFLKRKFWTNSIPLSTVFSCHFRYTEGDPTKIFKYTYQYFMNSGKIWKAFLYKFWNTFWK